MRKLFVFDLDDTLIDNVHDYAKPILDAIWIIIRTLGSKAPHVTKLITIEHEIDARRRHEINLETGKEFLYCMERFPGSQVATYREICQQTTVTPNPAVEAKLYQIGMKAFDERLYRRNIKPGVKQVLKFLCTQGDTLVLFSKGDSRVQTKKLKALKAAGIDCFTKVRVEDLKTPKIFQEICDEFPGLSPISIGNSYESDIIPALEVGYFGIYIPVETWEVIGKMDEIAAKVDKSRCLILTDIHQIISFYGRLP